jgi:Ca2+:H+ antiporter
LKNNAIVDWLWFAAPVAGLLAVGASFAVDVAACSRSPFAVVLVATVFAAVHHAEVVAHRIGEPYCALVLAVAVTVIGWR